MVDILGSIDDSIENNEKIIETLEEKMLLEYDSLISNASLSVSEMQEIFDISIGKTPPRKESHWFTENPEDVKWLSISDMGKAKVFAFDSSEKITAEGIEKYNVKIAPENTVLLSFKLTIGKVAITGCEMATNEAIAHFVSNDENIVEYLYCYLKRYNFDMLGNTSSIATAVNSKTIKAMKFYYPDTEILAEFHRIAEPLIKKIKHLLITNAKLDELKQLYLKKFFG
jgi:type I restriction enzyme S subunit